MMLKPLEDTYETVAKFREGGMGEIYKVRHRFLDEVRVVKVLHPHLENAEELSARFLREARAAARLRHPNVVQIFDFLFENGAGFLVMEHIDGVDLGTLIAHPRRPTLPLVLEVARQGLRAFDYLHRQGFLHRDVSPDNLMLVRDVDGRPLVKLIDLGIAKEVRGGDADFSAENLFQGKFRYASPEHFGTPGTGPLDARSDLYAFGVVLYELLTGQLPIRGEGQAQLLAGHLHQPPRDFDETDPSGRVPPDLRRVLLRALAKNPEERFASAQAMRDALGELAPRYPMTDVTLEEFDDVLRRRPAEVPERDSTRIDRPTRDEAMALAEPDPSGVVDAGELVDAAARIGEEARQLRRLLAEDQLDEARQRLISARRAYGEDRAFDAVQREIDTAAAAACRRHVEGCLEEAARWREKEEFPAALQSLERARGRIDPADRELCERLGREEREVEAALREAALGDTLLELERLADKGRLHEIERRLVQAYQDFGTDPRFEAWRERLGELRGSLS